MSKAFKINIIHYYFAFSVKMVSVKVSLTSLKNSDMKYGVLRHKDLRHLSLYHFIRYVNCMSPLEIQSPATAAHQYIVLKI